ELGSPAEPAGVRFRILVFETGQTPSGSVLRRQRGTSRGRFGNLWRGRPRPPILYNPFCHPERARLSSARGASRGTLRRTPWSVLGCPSKRGVFRLGRGLVCRALAQDDIIWKDDSLHSQRGCVAAPA